MVKENIKGFDGIHKRTPKNEFSIERTRDFINRHPRVIGGTALLAIILSGYSLFNSYKEINPTIEATNTEVTCDTPSWEMEEYASATSTTKAERDIVEGGIPKMKHAKNNAEMREGVYIALDEYKENPVRLAYASEQFLGVKVKPSELRDSRGCATPKAEKTVNDIRKIISLSEVKISHIPANGINSYVDKNGNIVKSSNPGIKGDLTVAEIGIPSGRIVYIDPDCANFQYLPPSTPNYYYPPVTVRKNPAQDVGVNPYVADYKQDATYGNANLGHKIDPSNQNNGSYVANGRQDNPVIDANNAESRASQTNNNLQINHVDAERSATVVDTDQYHGTSAPLPANW